MDMDDITGSIAVLSILILVCWVAYLYGKIDQYKKLLWESHNQYKIPISIAMGDMEKMVLEYYCRLAEEGFLIPTKQSAVRLCSSLLAWMKK
jgi:hypothetical protein